MNLKTYQCGLYTKMSTSTVENIYCNLHDTIQHFVNANDISIFKNHQHIISIFEHLSFHLGHEYYELLQKNTTLSIEQVRSYCNKNDLIGGGDKYAYGADWNTSPTNFRYLYHAHLILSHIRRLSPQLGANEWIEQSIVEVGCGYGGLCLAILDLAEHYYIRIPHYQLIDLPALIKLQKMYHDRVSEKIPLTTETQISYYSAFEYGKQLQSNHDLYFVSNYCFSEIAAEHQNEYRRHLLNPTRVSHGFMTWNHIPLYDFGYSSTYESETPLTGGSNLYVYF